MAETIQHPLNVFVSINFRFTACQPENAAKAFQLIRRKFGKWVTRPPRNRESAPATFVWVLEKPGNHVNSHWLVHVPATRQDEFKNRLSVWVSSATGEIANEQAAIHVRSAPVPSGAGRYMLKGMHPGWAELFDIEHEPQGWIVGRRSGFTKNIGPTQKRRLRAMGKYPKARHWIKGKFQRLEPSNGLQSTLSQSNF